MSRSATPIIKPPEQSKENKEQVRLSDIKKFGLSFWLIALSCVLIYNAVFPFNDNAPKFLQQKYHFGTTACELRAGRAGRAGARARGVHPTLSRSDQPRVHHL